MGLNGKTSDRIVERLVFSVHISEATDDRKDGQCVTSASFISRVDLLG